MFSLWFFSISVCLQSYAAHGFVALILLGVLWASWICALVSVIILENSQATITLNISSVHSSLFLLLIFLLYVCYSFCKFSIVLGHSIPSFSLFISLYFSCWSFYRLISIPRDSFLSLAQSTDRSIEHILYFYSRVSGFCHFLWICSYGFPCLWLSYSSVLVCYSFLELLAY